MIAHDVSSHFFADFGVFVGVTDSSVLPSLAFFGGDFGLPSALSRDDAFVSLASPLAGEGATGTSPPFEAFRGDFCLAVGVCGGESVETAGVDCFGVYGDFGGGFFATFSAFLAS